MRNIKTLGALALVLLTVPAFGAAYIKFDGIDGEVKAAGHEKWIELGSVQFEGGACNVATRDGSTHHATLELTEVPTALGDACATQKRFASVVADIDGRRHTLQNVSLSQCPAPATTKIGKGARVVVRIDFTACADHQAAAGHVKVFDGATVQLLGLTPEPGEVALTKTSLRGNTATVSFVRGTYSDLLGRQIPSTAAKVSKVDSLTIKQTTMNMTVTFTDALITSFVDGAEGPTLTFEFRGMSGAPAEFLRMVGGR